MPTAPARSHIMTFDITQDGIFTQQHGRRARVCRQPVEFVSYSQLDDTFYLRWPAESYHHMAALPHALLDDDRGGLAAWAQRNGLPLQEGMEDAFGEFLRLHAPAVTVN